MASKIIVVGDVNGHFSDLFGKLAKLHAKNSFAFAVIAGNLFANPDTLSNDQGQEVQKLLSGEIEVPLPTYFARGRSFSAAVVEKLTSNDGELCPNLSILGRRFKTSEGFKIVAIDGTYAPPTDDSIDEYAAVYTDKDIESAKDFKDADLLITSDWPAEVRDGSHVSYAADPPTGVEIISELCAILKPRYHFSTSSSVFEREPFFHPQEPPQPTTRFISLAPLNNPNKYKALYAFSLEPSAPPPSNLDGCTASPFATMFSRKRRFDHDGDGGQNGYRFSNGHRYHDWDDDGQHRESKRRRGGGRRQEPRQQECFFCLGNRTAETHMITSIGDDAYMTIAKGALSTRDTFPSVGHPLHMLIIPISHAPTFNAIESELQQPVLKEMQRYREAIHSMIASKSTKGAEDEAQLGAVTWEISKGSGVHLHWQIMPIPVNMIKKGLVEAAFEVEAENLHYPKFAKKASDIQEAEKGDYFKAMIWSESKQKDIVLPMDKGMRFDLQFGRRVLGKLLGLERRAHWRDCHQSLEEETADAEMFKDMFKQYDFSRVGEDDGQADEQPTGGERKAPVEQGG
ncbi:CWF19 1 [Lecanosticta acicola]|uniref:CWF19 1 n=1 Tax=Lecanosticta acicola TaxID=111012 RepID=A0AAI9EB49_9PEZI|nr:CWF19 1 [Lecanosticta acicola]